MKKLISIALILMMVFAAGCSQPSTEPAETPEATAEKVTETAEATEADSDVKEKVKVAVSIMPQKSLVEAVAGDYVEVVTMIPPGNSPANYAPSQKEMAALSDSIVYFSIAVPTEAVNIMPLIQDGDYDLKIVHLAEEVDAVHPARFFGEEHDHDHEEDGDHDHKEDGDHDHEEDGDHDHEGHDHAGRDPHIWLSAKRLIVMTEVIERELSALLPEHKDAFVENRKAFVKELSDVNDTLTESFNEVDDLSFLIYHPALGYFADDYGLNMMPLESEGKAATVQGMAKVIEYAKEHHIKKVFYQAEFDSKQAKLLAGEIGGEAIKLSPLSPNIVDNLKDMGNKIRNSME